MSAKSVAALVLLGILAGLGLASLLQPNRSALGFQAATCPDIPLYLLVTATPHAPPPTGTETPTASATPPPDTHTPTATETATATATASPSHTPTPTDTGTPIPSETTTPIPSGTPTGTATETATGTPTSTRTPTPSATSIPVLLPPTNVITTPQHYRVGFSWTWASGASAVVIEQMVSETAWVPVASILSGTGFPVWVNGLTCFTQYEFRLKSYRASDRQYSDYIVLPVRTAICETTPTPTLTVTPTSTRTATPTNTVTPTPIPPTDTPMPTSTPLPVPTVIWVGQVILSWTDNSTDESEFRIERSPDGSTWVEIATVPADVTTYTDTDPALQCGATYYYRVRAYRASDGQFSPYSGVASVDIPACEGTPTTESPTSTPTETPTVTPTPSGNETPTEAPYLNGSQIQGCIDSAGQPIPCPGRPLAFADAGLPIEPLAAQAAGNCERQVIDDFDARPGDLASWVEFTTTYTPTAYPTPEPYPTPPLTQTPVVNPTPTFTPPPGSGTVWQFAGVVNGQVHVARWECWAGWDWEGLPALPYLRLDWLN